MRANTQQNSTEAGNKQGEVTKTSSAAEGKKSNAQGSSTKTGNAYMGTKTNPIFLKAPLTLHKTGD